MVSIPDGKPLTGELDAGDPPVQFGGRGKVQFLVPTPICRFVPAGRENLPPTVMSCFLRGPNFFRAEWNEPPHAGCYVVQGDIHNREKFLEAAPRLSRSI